MSGNESMGLEAWVDRLSASGLPIFSETVRAVSGVVARRETSAHDLAKTIGKDASLTARLLKVANSPMFNLQHRSIDTISSAVVLLGFDAVRELAVSLSLIEQVLKGRSHVRVTRSMARSFHAAAQARSFAGCKHHQGPEEVFVAALLMNIGEMAFWSMAQQEAAAIDRMTASGASVAQAELHVLGFRLPELTARLVDVWHLGGLLEDTVTDADDDERVHCVRLGHRVAESVELYGWDSAEVREVLEDIADYLDLNGVQVKDLVQSNVEEAAKIATRYGVAKVHEYLLEDEAGAAETVPSRPAAAAPDPQAQLESLQQIAAELEAGSDLDKLLSLVMAGITRGVGFDRAYFALLTPDRRGLKMKHAQGLQLRRNLDISSKQRNIFQLVIGTGKSLQVQAENRDTMAGLLDGEVAPWLGGGEFVVMPVRVAGKVVGILYADNDSSRGAISEAAFAGFRHFGQQVSLGLNTGAN